MTAPRDLLSVQIEAARKRKQAALDRAAAEDVIIEDLIARRNARHTQDLRRASHWPKRVSRAEREIAALIAIETSL